MQRLSDCIGKNIFTKSGENAGTVKNALLSKNLKTVRAFEYFDDREDEHEMIPVCRQFGMALTPYSSLAAGRLTRPTWDAPTRRSETDVISQKKFDPMREQDIEIVTRVAELAEKHDVPMAAIAIAWLWARGVESPIVGCSRAELVGEACRALEVELTDEERAYLEEPYVPHPLVGVRPHELAELLPR